MREIVQLLSQDLQVKVERVHCLSTTSAKPLKCEPRPDTDSMAKSAAPIAPLVSLCSGTSRFFPFNCSWKAATTARL